MLIFNKDIVETILKNECKKIATICRQKFEAFGMGDRFNELGVSNLGIRWVDEGEESRIHEYDGLKSVWLKKNPPWWRA